MEKLKPIEHKFKALFYGALKGVLESRAGRSSAPLNAAQMTRVIIFRPDRLGDMVITLPLADGLKKYFPHLKISILASPKNLLLIKGDPRFEEIFVFTKKIWRAPGELWPIKRRKFDCIIDTVFEDSVTTLYLTHYCAAGAPIIGMGKNKFSRYYDFTYDNSGGHIIDNTLKLLSAFGIDSTQVSGYAEPHLSQLVLDRAEAFFKSLAASGAYPLKVGINLSSGAPTRVWQEEKWIELIKNVLAAVAESQIILIAVPNERELALRVKNLFKERVEVVPDNLNIAEISAIIKYLDVLVTPDTSLVHIARAYRVPVVGLYSRFAKNFNLWHPYGMKEQAIKAIHIDNIFDISVEQVMNGFLFVVSGKQEVKR